MRHCTRVRIWVVELVLAKIIKLHPTCSLEKEKRIGHGNFSSWWERKLCRRAMIWPRWDRNRMHGWARARISDPAHHIKQGPSMGPFLSQPWKNKTPKNNVHEKSGFARLTWTHIGSSMGKKKDPMFESGTSQFSKTKTPQKADPTRRMTRYKDIIFEILFIALKWNNHVFFKKSTNIPNILLENTIQTQWPWPKPSIYI